MKKNIAYYFEDPERLSEVSINELNQWVEEMPYSQSLRLLVDMKSEQSPSSNGDVDASYGAFFAQDYEPLSKKETKELAEKDTMLPIDTASELEGIIEKENSDLPSTITHNLVDDVSEDLLEDDLLEINPNVVLVNEVSHEEADEILEAEVENEVLEISLEDVEEVTSFSALDNMLNEDLLITSYEEADEDEIDFSEENENTKDKYAGLVDYKSFVVGVSDEEIKEKESGKYESDEEVLDFGDSKKMEDDLNIEKAENTDFIKDILFVESPKKIKSKSKDKDKKAKKRSKKIDSKKKDKLKKKLSKKSKVKAEKAISSKRKIKPIKSIKGEIVKKDLSLKSKPVKRKGKKIKKQVKYVVVNEATTNDFKLKDFDGVSNFTNWLLEKKSINGDLVENKMKTKDLTGKKKSKKKKKKKKSKVLKVAQDSVKKSDMILSEPLANIMAAQGHTKKAKKMYKQLGLIFPEKSSYFAAKIEKLKNK